MNIKIDPALMIQTHTGINRCVLVIACHLRLPSAMSSSALSSLPKSARLGQDITYGQALRRRRTAAATSGTLRHVLP